MSEDTNANDELDRAAREAREGDRTALERLIAGLQDRVYGLALRMMWHPEDARDATQEILLRVITHLGDFRGESAVMTWVYRIAGNHLISARRSRVEKENYSFARFAAELDKGLNDGAPLEDTVMLEEIKVGCTLGMLQCLDREHRLAYILGEILDLDGLEAAQILALTPAGFRQRLSRARSAIVAFMRAKCGLVRSSNPCRCARRVESARANGRLDPAHAMLAADPGAAHCFAQVVDEIRDLHEAQRVVALYRSHPRFSTSRDFVPMVRELLAACPVRSTVHAEAGDL
jgi:RNA polymerase sigma factor (sigma-70 family)